MSFFSAIIGFLTALPDMVSLVTRFISWVNQVSGNNPQAWIKNIGVAFDALRAAETTEEKLLAAKSIADTISGL